MNIPKVVFEGDLKDGAIAAIIEALKKFVGRRGRLLWVDTD